MEIHHHNDTSFHCNSKERNIANRHSDAEVVMQEPLEQQSSTHRIDSGKDKDESLGY